MNVAFVVDCSIAMTWLFNDEATAKTAELLDRLSAETALVPAWWFDSAYSLDPRGPPAVARLHASSSAYDRGATARRP